MVSASPAVYARSQQGKEDQMSQIPHNALIVIADGGGARLFRNAGTATDLTLRQERVLAPESLIDDGPSGSRPEEQTPRQTDEATFAKQLVQALYKMKHGNQFSDLVLVADPQTLGQMRSAMHSTVQASIVLTLDKDFTNHAIDDIAKALR